MKATLKVFLSLSLLVALYLPLSGCGCGFSCNNDDDDNDAALLTLGLSDALPEDLTEVVIKVDSITFRRSGADDVVVDTFTIPDQSLTNADNFQVDLLEYQGMNQLSVIEELELPTGTYSAVIIKILVSSIEDSYVLQTSDNLQKQITVSGGQLTLPGMELSSGSQTFTVEFSLAQSLQLQDSGNYLLTADGIRVENNGTDASLTGQIDSDLFDTVSPCTEKSDPLQGNRVYLYTGHDRTNDSLADVFTSDSEETPPSDAIAPYAVASIAKNSLTNNWEYAFGFLPPGDYTMAFACDTQNDDAVEYNGLTIPLPESQVYEIVLEEGVSAQCNLTEDADC